MKRCKVLGLGFYLAAALSFAQSDDAPRFQATANAADKLTPIGGKGSIGVGFYTETVYPMGRPFQSTTPSGRENMRFQIPLGFGLEASYGFTKRIEAALSLGFDYFKTQNLRSVSGTGTKTFDEAKFRLYPITGIFRYRWPRGSWAPEAEVGLGAAMGDITITATKDPREVLKHSGPFYRAHIAGGTGFVWGEGASLHLQVGYAYNQLGKKTYTYSDSFTVDQEASLSGIYTKAYLKFYF